MAEAQTSPPEIAALSFEDALNELETIVRKLESGGAKLDEALASYERGALLKLHCEAKLREAQLRVEKIVVSAEGAVSAEPNGLE
jgi:exodeoxyribonuclease VII small subunit